ncbi:MULTISPECIES: redoxin domain-containing protein [Niastella]|uniref:Redoxin domain-containing protein n=1 Tax=Niastella soli TaxID=2821487 RepID=A0ABS3Z224_9BACT|nr:redoxin domain-containing protein [Niastella soli]MBO9204185.1 redoxin domain-containing protein [Niastella soli]
MNKGIMLAATLTVVSHGLLQAQNAKDTTRQYYYRLATSKETADRALVTGKLYDGLKSNKEQDWILALNMFSVMKKKATSDSLLTVIKARFPKGETWRNEDVQTIYNAGNAAEKETAYKKWLQQYPMNRFEGSRIIYDYASNSVASAFAEEKNVKKALYYSNLCQTPAWKGEAWAGVATRLEKNGYTAEALPLFKKAMANAYAFKTTRTKEEGAQFAAMGYRGYSTSIARIYLKQKENDSALAYIQKAYAEGKNGAVNYTYSEILQALGRDKEAFEKADEFVQTGEAEKQFKEMHKALYEKLNTGGKPYAEYMKEMEAAITKKVIENLKNTIVNKPSPAWVLKDVNGNTVNSESLKGKVVVLDFWATWCGPCKRSFPAMQMAVNKFKDNPNVQFLFIHTWEKGAGDATAAAKKYIDDNKFPFQVLMDLKDPETGSNNVVESFGISGIPTKFILDKNGNIRFRVTGFTGSDEAAVEEISAMIEMVERS